MELFGGDYIKEYVLLLKIGKTNYRFNCVLENYLTTCCRGISVIFNGICAFICFSIGINALIKQEIPVTKTRIWKGKSTLFLAIPLIVLGILMTMLVIKNARWCIAVNGDSTQPDKLYQSHREHLRRVEKINADMDLNMQQARTYLEAGQPDKAIQEISNLIALFPDKPDNDFPGELYCFPYHFRAGIYASMRQHDKAISDYSSIIKLSSSKKAQAEAYCYRGNSYKDMEQYDKAMLDYSKAVELKPDYADAYYYRGWVCHKMQQYDKAMLDYSNAIELTPDNAGAYYLRAYAYVKLKQPDKAILDCSKAIELKPDYADAYYYRGWIYNDIKQYDKAVPDHSKAIELKPDYLDAYCERACAYSEMKLYEKAAQDYSKALELQPDCATPYLSMMEICIITANPEQFNQWVKHFDAAVPEAKLSKGELQIKLYLLCVHKKACNATADDIEPRLDALLKENIHSHWSFGCMEEWLNNPNSKLMPEQVKYIRGLTEKIKTAQKKSDINAKL